MTTQLELYAKGDHVVFFFQGQQGMFFKGRNCMKSSNRDVLSIPLRLLALSLCARTLQHCIRGGHVLDGIANGFEDGDVAEAKQETYSTQTRTRAQGGRKRSEHPVQKERRWPERCKATHAVGRTHRSFEAAARVRSRAT